MNALRTNGGDLDGPGCAVKTTSRRHGLIVIFPIDEEPRHGVFTPIISIGTPPGAKVRPVRRNGGERVTNPLICFFVIFII